MFKAAKRFREGILISCIVLMTLTFSVEAARAFNIDGFYTGMTRVDAFKLAVRKNLSQKAIETYESKYGDEFPPYDLGFCGEEFDRLSFVGKELSPAEFLSVFYEHSEVHGNPFVDTPVGLSDHVVLYLKWKLSNADEVTLILSNSGEKPLYRVNFINNAPCD